MRTRVLALLLAAASVGGYLGVAEAKPGPNGNNDHGLCTAYFNGQKNGHDDGSPGPFFALEEAGREKANTDGQDNDGDGDVDEGDEGASFSPAEAAFYYCDGVVIGGQPEHGRYTCEIVDYDSQCTENDAPGNSGNRGGGRG